MVDYVEQARMRAESFGDGFSLFVGDKDFSEVRSLIEEVDFRYHGEFLGGVILGIDL